MRRYAKKDFPVSDVRRFLEPGPIVLLSSVWRGERNVMTMGWHMIMGQEPSLVGCYIWAANHSFELVRRGGECVINVPTADLAKIVVGIGNTSGRDIDKFEKFKLTASRGVQVAAPVIEECYANFECRVFDGSLVRKYSLFVLEIVRAHVATSPKFPRTLHYRGDGRFMISGPTVDRYRKGFKRENL